MMKRLFLIATILAVLCGGAAFAEITLEKLRADLISSWLVTVEGEGRTRTLRIQGIEQKDQETFSLDAAYGWTDGNQTTIKAAIRQTSQERILAFTTQTGYKIAANQQPDGTFTGTFTSTSGMTKGIRIERLSEDELRKTVSALKAATTAGTSINTNGSQEGIAISGFDTVAFFTEKKALHGKSEYSYEWMGAKWFFSTQENLNLFKANPEQYAPQFGGNCSYGVSEGYISSKPANGMFEIMKGKLYLFPDGKDSSIGARSAWWQTGGGPNRRIADGDLNWPALKANLEARRKSSTIPTQVRNPAVNTETAR